MSGEGIVDSRQALDARMHRMTEALVDRRVVLPVDKATPERKEAAATLEATCPRCGRSNVTKCGKANGYCLRCDDQTSYDYCTPRPLDTSTLGPIRVEPNAIADRARVVREALMAAAKDEPDYRVVACLEVAAELATDETLAKLGRLIR